MHGVVGYGDGRGRLESVAAFVVSRGVAVRTVQMGVGGGCFLNYLLFGSKKDEGVAENAFTLFVFLDQTGNL